MNEALVVMSVIMGIAIIILGSVNAENSKTLKSKKMYDDMYGRMTEERRMIKEDRQAIKQGNASLVKEVDSLKTVLNQKSHDLRTVFANTEELANRYVKIRLSLLQLQRPDIKDSPNELYQIQDLLQSKKKGNIDSFKYLIELDKVFDALAKK